MDSNETFTTEKKVEKFDELMAEFGKLITYRHNLSNTIAFNLETTIEEQLTESGGYINKPVDKTIEMESLINIQNEISRIEDLISFINGVVYGDKITILESKINSDQLT